MSLQRIYKAATDPGFLEQLAFIIFVSGFKYDIVEQRWPNIRKAFWDFDIEKVAICREKEFSKLMKSHNMIKNQDKIVAIIENAHLIFKISRKHGSAIAWIKTKVRGLRDEKTPEDLAKILLSKDFQRFKRIGATTSLWLSELYYSRNPCIDIEI